MPKNTVVRSKKQKFWLGFQIYDVIAESILAGLLLQENSEQKFKISTFRNIWETYITPQYLENVSKIVKKFEV